jgi:hypothetical protein
MKNIYKTLGLLMALFAFSHQSMGQCTNNNTQYLDLTPTGVGNTQSSSCTYAGEYNTVSVIAGVSYTFSVCGAGYDTQITLINDGTGAVEGYNDDFCGLQSEITWTATYTGVVRVLLDQYFCTHNTTCTGMTVTQNTAPAPTGGCATATATTCGSTVTGSTVGEAAPTFGTCGTTVGTGGAVWYEITGDGNTWTAETTGGSNYDTKIWVFSGSCAALTCVTGNDDGGAGTLSLVNFATTAGTTYYIVVGGFGASEGNYEMSITNDLGCSTCAPPPAPITTDGSVCGPGVVNLAAAGTGGTLEWYDAPIGGNLIGTGTAYNPNLSSTTTYYVQESAAGGGAPTSITTLFAENNGQSGIMFDITALNDITINDFETNVDATGDFEIYYRAGTHVGNTTNAGAWTLVGSATGVPNNPVNTATPIPIPVNIFIPAGQTYAFYITFTNGTFMNYTNGTAVGNVYTADANLQVREGTGKAYAFGTDFATRIFNGNINYTPGAVCNGPRSAVTGNVVSPPTAPAAIDAAVCTNGSATLGATVTSGNVGATLNWYDAATGGNLVGTGTTYNTPPLTNNATYYVEEDGGAPASLTTLWAENNGQSGVMFDIAATNAVTITSFDMNCDLAGDWEIYYRTGTHVGNTTNAGAWTLVGSATGVPNNPVNTPTPIPIPVNVNIPAGQTYSFYVTYSSGTGMNYTNGTAVGNVYSSDANISIMEGTGKAYPFGADYTPRIPNMNVYYTTGSGCNSPRTPVNASLRAPVYAATALTTTTNGTCVVNEAGVDWTYYYDNANPEDLLFAIAKDPSGLGNNTFTADVDITVNNNPTTTGYYWAEDLLFPTARWVMGRYWNVNITGGAMVDPVWVRFYYDPAEKAAIMNAATAWQAIHGGNLSGYVHFKTVGNPFDPATDLYAGGVYTSIELANNTDNLTTANGVNYVEYTNVQSFSGGSIIVGVTPFNPTPQEILLDVDLNSFAVNYYEEDQAMIEWATLNETDLAQFEIERSSDAMSFESIATLMASGNLNGDEYQHIDAQPMNGINYYRLKIIERDGSVHYSEVKALNFGAEEVLVNISPNPFNNNGFNIELATDAAGEVSVHVLDIRGVQVHQQDFLVEVGANQLNLSAVEDWPSGTYIVQINTGTNLVQKRIIKQ